MNIADRLAQYALSLRYEDLSEAVEVQCRFQNAANLFRRGWDHVNYVLIASAVAAGKLMKLSQGQLTQAINIAVNGHMAMRQVRAGELTDWKGISAPNVARN